MNEAQQRRCFRSTGKIARGVARRHQRVFGDRECHALCLPVVGQLGRQPFRQRGVDRCRLLLRHYVPSD